ncbi:hypothetical protein EBR57_01610 [bacterium]|nr:hypothetical protein [bacterium]
MLRTIFHQIYNKIHAGKFTGKIPRAVYRLKYRASYMSQRADLISNQKLSEIRFPDKERSQLLHDMFIRTFHGTVSVQGQKYYFTPGATILVPDSIENYLKAIGPSSRNMIKKAQKKGYITAIFDWNSRLDDIYKINRSSTFRQGKAMPDSYIKYPYKVDYSVNSGTFKVMHLGVFFEDGLVAYLELFIYGNFAVCNRILGHKEYLADGIMNLLIYSAIDRGVTHRDFEFLNYLSMRNVETNSLSGFKKRVGFSQFLIKSLY